MNEPITINALRFFDSEDEFSVAERRLPHWSQAGTLTFLTWRTWDSIPHAVAESWQRDRSAWLAKTGIDPTDPNWRQRLDRLSDAVRGEYHKEFSERWEKLLDACHGDCVLRNPQLANIVAASLKHFNGTRYLLTDFVIMPNHVHLLVMFPDSEMMLSQCESWKRFTAGQVNKQLGRTGRFWQTDCFDHLVRSNAQFESLRRYIKDNPSKAKLNEREFVHYSLDLEQVGNSLLELPILKSSLTAPESSTT